MFYTDYYGKTIHRMINRFSLVIDSICEEDITMPSEACISKNNIYETMIVVEGIMALISLLDLSTEPIVLLREKTAEWHNDLASRLEYIDVCFSEHRQEEEV